MARLGFLLPQSTYFFGSSIANKSSVMFNNKNGDGIGAAFRSGNSGGGGTLRFAQTDADANNVTVAYARMVFRARKLPTTSAKLMTWTLVGGGTNIEVRFNTNGTLSFYNSVSATNLIVTSSVISVGTDSASWTTIEWFVDPDAAIGTTTIKVNGTQIFSGAPSGAGSGLNGATTVQSIIADMCCNGANNGAEMDLDSIVVDDASFPIETQKTIVAVNANGNYTNWAGAQPNFKARVARYNQTTTSNRVSTASLSARQSYVCQSLADLGITGNILGALVVGLTGPGISGPGNLFIRRNSVDSDASVFTWSASATDHQSRFSTTGWLNTDTLEVGFLSGTGVGTYNWYWIYLIIEHDTPYVAPAEDADVQVLRQNYTGTGAILDITLSMTDPDFFMIWPRTGSAPGCFWHKGMIGPKQIAANSGYIWHSPWILDSHLYMIDGDAAYNSNTVVYDILMVKDPSKRILGTGSFWEIDQTVPYDTEHTIVPLPSLQVSPDFLHSNPETIGTLTTLNTYFVVGPSQAADNVVTWLAQVLQTNRIQSVGPTSFDTRRGMFAANTQSFPFWTLRKAGINATKVIDVVNYTGDGNASQVVTLDLGGLTPVWIMAFPRNAGVRYFRNNQQSDSKGLDTSTSATAITAMAANSATVGLALNTNAIVYTLVVFAEGTDAFARNQYSGIYFMDPTVTHDTLWDRTGAPATTNVKIPNPTLRTRFIGDNG